eukprot:11173140-Lingulodinium_polyedra.AAC.1
MRPRGIGPPDIPCSENTPRVQTLDETTTWSKTRKTASTLRRSNAQQRTSRGKRPNTNRPNVGRCL